MAIALKQLAQRIRTFPEAKFPPSPPPALLDRITDELLVHVRGLLKLFHIEEPLAVQVRPSDRGKLRYHAGNASAEGFAAGTQYPDQMLEGRDGLWRPDFTVGGSNLREAQNIVNHLLTEVKQGRHDE